MNQKNDYFYSTEEYFNEINLINEKQSRALIFGIILDKYFIDPEHPTPNEITLFELEHGEIYSDVIVVYNIINDNFKRN